MRFYRLHRTHDAGISLGYEYFSSYAAANKVSRDWLKENPDESADVVEIEVAPGKSGILAALNREARHPDNG